MKFNFKVASSAIQKIHYDSETETLGIVFTSSNKLYNYGPVPKKTIINFVKAPSVGKFYHKEIRNKYNMY